MKLRKFNKTQVFFLIGAVLFTALFLFSGIMAMRQYKDTKQSAEAFNAVADLVKPAPTPVLTSVEDATGEDGTDTPASYEPAPELTAYDKYAAVYEQNSDFIGWISIEDTKINYPVMQTPGNKDFYLKHAFDKSYSEYGVPYMQENCKLGLSGNCVIYGHHMQDGSMFADLCKYESEDFYKEHKTIHFDTLAGFGEYEIVCVFKTAAYSADGFKYYHFVDAADAAEFNSFLSTCQSLALYDTGVSAEYGDKLITLSTCEYSRSNGRMVIVAKLVQPAANEVGGNG
jgi:sortase B